MFPLASLMSGLGSLGSASSGAKGFMTMRPGAYGGWPTGVATEPTLMKPKFGFADMAGSMAARGGGGGGSSPFASMWKNALQDQSHPDMGGMMSMMGMANNTAKPQNQPMQMPMNPFIAEMLRRSGVM